MSKFKWLTVCMWAAALIALAGCSSGGDGKEQANDEEEQMEDAAPSPVTLRVLAMSGALNENDFNQYIIEPVKEQLPHITLEYLPSGGTNTPAELLAARAFPDLVMTGERYILDLLEFGIPVDLRDQVRRSQIDLKLYREDAINSVLSYGKGELYGLPNQTQFYVTYYNKDIFDRLSVDYPRDNMLWEEARELAIRLTREVDGFQYRGLQPGNVTLMARGLSLGYVDGERNQARVNTDGWIQVFRTARDIFTIPGNAPRNLNSLSTATNEFFEAQDIAMLPFYGDRLPRAAELEEKSGFSWDIATYPSFPQTVGTTAEVDSIVWVLSSTSEHQDQAFQLIRHLTMDPGIQSKIAHRGTAFPALKLDNFNDIFGIDYPVLASKNIAGALAPALRIPPEAHPYDAIVRRQVQQHFLQYLSGAIDPVEALRAAEEASTQQINQQ